MALTDKVALVTGASRGIGAAIADLLGTEGATVIGTATSEEGAAKITARLKEKGIKGKGMALNVADPESIASVVAAINEEYGAPAILVNNAGITKDNLLMRMKDDEWFDVIDTNLNAIYRLSKACLRGMSKARWGRIINIGSVVGAMGNPGQTNYCATKAGVGGFTRSLAKEVGSRGITVNAVAPGFIETDMTTDVVQAAGAEIKKRIPVKRLGQPDDIANAVLFFAADESSYVTGQILKVDGGLTLGGF